MADTVVKTVENVDRLFSQIVVNGEVYESENYVAPTPSQQAPSASSSVESSEVTPPTDEQNVQGEDIYGVDLNGVLHDFVDDTVPDKIQQAVESLDVPSSGGSGKYIKSISQTDGKIVATEGNITDSVTSDSTDPVTSGAVASALAVPTDAVLHYSFDQVPDYPDGTAVYYRNKNFTTVETWSTNASAETLSVSDNCLKIQSLGTRQGMVYVNNAVFSNANINGKIIKIKFYCPDFLSAYLGDNGGSYTLHNVFTVSELGNGWYIATCIGGNYDYSQTLNIRNKTISADNYALLESIYIGDGSYSTPVIDNANGEHNGTNNGGLAVKGVSGKGVYLIAGKFVSVSGRLDLDLQDRFTFSFWYNPSEATTGINGTIINSNMIAIRNGMSWNNNLTVVIFYSDNTNTPIYTIYLPAKAWYHIVCVKDGLQVNIYVDSVKVKSGTLENKTLRALGSTLSIGISSCERNQSVDDLLIFDRALSETEIKALYLNKANTPKYYSWADWKISQLTQNSE